jgi:Uri superfamily endonuclease
MTPTKIPHWLRSSVAAAGVAGRWLTAEDLETAPNEAGAYALALRLDGPVAINQGGDTHCLVPGWFVYLGSARGPGGLRARIRRHFRRDKPVHWHVDQLTSEPAEIAALAVPGGAECDLVARLLACGRFRVAAPGFGSSDCRRCASHLLTAG